MNNHIIIGPNNRCLCGNYNNKSIHCSMIIESFDQIEDDSILLLKIMKNMIIDMDNVSNDPISATGENKPSSCKCSVNTGPRMVRRLFHRILSFLFEPKLPPDCHPNASEGHLIPGCPQLYQHWWHRGGK